MKNLGTSCTLLSRKEMQAIAGGGINASANFRCSAGGIFIDLTYCKYACVYLDWWSDGYCNILTNTCVCLPPYKGPH